MGAGSLPIRLCGLDGGLFDLFCFSFIIAFLFKFTMLEIKRSVSELSCKSADSFDVVDERGSAVLRIQGDVARRVYFLMKLEKRRWADVEGKPENVVTTRIHNKFNCHAAVYKVYGNLKEKTARDTGVLREFAIGELIKKGETINEESLNRSMKKNIDNMWDYIEESFCRHEGVTLYNCGDYFKTLTDFPVYFQVFDDSCGHVLHSGVILGLGKDGKPYVFEKMGCHAYPFRIVPWDDFAGDYMEKDKMSLWRCRQGKIGFGKPEVR